MKIIYKKCDCTKLQAITTVCDNLSVTQCDSCWYIYEVWGKNWKLSQEKINTISDEKAKKIGEFVKRQGFTLEIKWQKTLLSYINWEISYKEVPKNELDFKLSFTICNLSDLEYWDVFINSWIVTSDINTDYFHIFIWKDTDWFYRRQFLRTNTDIEHINVTCDNENEKVIKINRS